MDCDEALEQSVIDLCDEAIARTREPHKPTHDELLAEVERLKAELVLMDKEVDELREQCEVYQEKNAVKRNLIATLMREQSGRGDRAKVPRARDEESLEWDDEDRSMDNK
jgi:hypothetical protein